MSQQRRHPQRQVEGKRAAKEWGKFGKRIMHEQRIARRLSRELVRRLTRDSR